MHEGTFHHLNILKQVLFLCRFPEPWKEREAEDLEHSADLKRKLKLQMAYMEQRLAFEWGL